MTTSIMPGKQVTVNPTAGTVQVKFRDLPLLDGATAEVAYHHDGRPVRLRLAGPDVSYGVGEEGVTLSRCDQHVELLWTLRRTAGPGEGLEAHLEVHNIGTDVVLLDELIVLDADSSEAGTVQVLGAPRLWRFYQLGWQSWSPAFARHVDDGLYTDPGTDLYRTKHQPHPVPAWPTTLTSEWMTVLASRPSLGEEPAPALLIGFVTAKDQLAEVRLQLEGGTFHRLSAIAYADGVPLEPGQSLTSERLVVVPGDRPQALLEGWASRLGSEMDARVPSEVPTGWCTWYWFFGKNTANDVLRNVVEIKKARLPLEWILIDDGYQQAIGDWLAVRSDRFPDGMATLAEEIHRAGHKAMLWVAPFGVSANSELFAAHPDWVLRDQADEPVLAWQHMGEEIYALDLTHPEVQDWLRATFETMSQDWGYDGFKIDFVFAGALPGRHHDPCATRAQTLRRGLETIRQAIGERFLLGCGVPLAPAVGVVDAARIGPDVNVTWEPVWEADLTAPSTENAVRNIFARSFTHRRLWLNDPDCVLIRRRDDYSDLVLNEMRTLVSAIGLSGGLVLSGDNFATIRPGRIKYLRQVLPPSGTAATPVDLFENELPGLLVLPVVREWGRWWVVAVLNWDDRTRRTTIELADLGLDPEAHYHVYNYWRRRYVGVTRTRFTVPRHQPHETTILLFKPVGERPELLTSTFHVTQGAVEVTDVTWEELDEDLGRLRVEVVKAGRQEGELLFTVPVPWQVGVVRVNGRRRGVNQIARDVVGIGFTLDQEARVEIQFTAVPRIEPPRG
jgi:alpha-galactosidase